MLLDFSAIQNLKYFLPKVQLESILNSICASSCEAENGVLPALISQAENSKVPADENTIAFMRLFWTTNQLSYSSSSRIRSKTFSPLKLS